tara:strand:- start:1095 stop:1535 length:441 start_codon:yes stop_codon:yes gene_type:complete
MKPNLKSLLSMRSVILIMIIALFETEVSAQKTTRFTPLLNSNWSNPLNWSNGKPSANDTTIVQVFLSDNCRVNENASVHDLYNENGGNLIIEDGITLIVNGDLYLAGGSTIQNFGNLEIKGTIYQDGFTRLQVFSSINVEGSISFD